MATAPHPYIGPAPNGKHVPETTPSALRKYLPAIFSFTLLASGLITDQLLPQVVPEWLRLVWYLAAFLPVGLPTALTGFRLLRKGDVFTEFTLMTIATVGAFLIGEYPEGVAVMLFYTVGEYFQEAAVARSRQHIKALLDVRPETASVVRGGVTARVSAESVAVGETIRVLPGERVPLDGTLVSGEVSFNTAALTGESRPSGLSAGDEVLAGMINEDGAADIRVSRPFQDSALSRILSLVEDAVKRKAKTELFIRRFARAYTPAVALLAALITLVPALVVEEYVFRDWLYRALIFLVISCPCALVISIPLGYFGGIGAASANGILFKGSNFLDLMSRVSTVVFDKTGTLTEGVFRVQKVVSFEGVQEETWLPLAGALEAYSTHPVARAIAQYTQAAAGTDTGAARLQVTNPEEVRGQGLKGYVAGRKVVAGNMKLLQEEGIVIPHGQVEHETETIVLVAVDGRAAGYVVVADQIREDSAATIEALQQRGIEVVMLSGDKQSVVDAVGQRLQIGRAYGELLPEDKVERLKALKTGPGRIIAFVGDGLNDAPALALSDVGIAMGGLGSDAAVETADVVIQADQPSKIVKAVELSRATRRVIWQNILFAFGVKAVVLLLGAGGLATMWEAVFADVGVALLAILNASRIGK
jgi:Cd2+/Zn2+-exporting ATPase